MTAGEELANLIQQYVASQVPPELVPVVTAAACRTVATLMEDPNFTNRLALVAALRQENSWLKTQILGYQRLIAAGTAPTKKPRKRAAATSTSRPSKAPTKRSTTSPPTTARTRTPSRSSTPRSSTASVKAFKSEVKRVRR